MSLKQQMNVFSDMAYMTQFQEASTLLKVNVIVLNSLRKLSGQQCQLQEGVMSLQREMSMPRDYGSDGRLWTTAKNVVVSQTW